MRRQAGMLSVLSLAAMAATVQAREFAGLTLRGPTGFVLCPTGTVLREDWFAMGITGGVAKADYGLFGVAEAGLLTPDLLANPALPDWKRELTAFFKAGGSPSPEAWWMPAVAVGGARGVFAGAPDAFGCASWSPSAAGWIVEAAGGYGTGSFLNEPFGGLAVIPAGLFNRAIKFIVDYAGERASAGGRIALSRDLRLDAFVLMNAFPPSTDHSGRGWLIVVTRGLPGASWTGDARLRRLFGVRTAPAPAG